MAIADILIALLLIGVAVFAYNERRKADQREDGRLSGGEDTRRTAEEVRELRARIQVLERVITDNHGSAGLSSEIERLRDR